VVAQGVGKPVRDHEAVAGDERDRLVRELGIIERQPAAAAQHQAEAGGRVDTTGLQAPWRGRFEAGVQRALHVHRGEHFVERIHSLMSWMVGQEL